MVERVDQDPQLQGLYQDAIEAGNDPTGKLRGENVAQQRNAQSLVHDSLEEVGFAASNLYSIAEQEESVDVESVEVEDVSVVIADEIKKKTKLRDELTGRRGSLDSAQVQKLLAKLRLQLPISHENILRYIHNEYGDVTDQYAALDAVIRELARKRGDRELKKALKKAADTLWEQSSTAIIAGLNASSVADRFAHGSIEQFQALRDAYRTQVQEQPSMLESLRKLRERFGDDELERQIKFLIAAAGRDLDALVSSIDREQLSQIIEELSRLEMIGSMRTQAGTIVDRIAKRFGGVGNEHDWDLLEDAMVLMQDKWVGSQKVEALNEKLSLRDLEGQIYFLRELNAFFRNIPVKAYDDSDRRTQLLDASQDALDHLVQKEEDEL
ncbi:MAG: TyeA family type III secretion system gatekeeper subunit [Pseudomonadota bacterium]